jgi:hypothetical protein
VADSEIHIQSEHEGHRAKCFEFEVDVCPKFIPRQLAKFNLADKKTGESGKPDEHPQHRLMGSGQMPVPTALPSANLLGFVLPIN